MKFTVSRQELRSALDNIKGTVKPVHGMEWTGCIKFDVIPGGITVTGYNMETGVIASVDADATGMSVFLVNLEKLTALVTKLSGDTLECTVDNDNDIMAIKCGRSNVKIPTMSAINYPSVPYIDTEKSFLISGETLAEMIHQTVFAVSVMDNKPILMGELFEIDGGSFNIVALDGYRMAVRTEPVSISDTYKFVVKGNVLKSVARLVKGDVTVIPSKKHVIFDFGSTKIFTRLLEGDFHNYKGSMPANSEATAEVSVKPLIECLERFSLLIDGKIKAPLRCEFGDGKLEMSMKTAHGEITDYVDIDFSGSPVIIGFNNQYLLDAVKASASDKVRFEISGAQFPMKLVPLKGDAYTYLVLPLRMKQ